ncbi:MAG: glycosyltransferase [Phycisphaerales bacterium]|nr:glycosyltransferase [Planctomycetota bacterium]
MASDHNKAGLVIVLPRGFETAGVTSWSVRLANALADSRDCSIIAHQNLHGPARAALDPRIAVLDASHLPHSPQAWSDFYLAAAERPAIFLCQQLAESFTACADLTRRTKSARIIGIAHSDNAYDVLLLQHFEPALTAAIAVSSELERKLQAAWPTRTKDVHRIAAGVELGPERPSHSQHAQTREQPLRIIYTGRMEDSIKRVSALPELSASLDRAGIAHTLTLVGDGPAAPVLDALIASRPHIRRIATVSPEQVRPLLREADIFVLASRLEGLSLSMLEAMSESCCCVITQVASGAAEVISHGANGLLVQNHDSPAEVGRLLAQAIAHTPREEFARLGRAARETIRQHYTIESQAAATARLLDAAAVAPPRLWPIPIAPHFTSPTVPPGAELKLRATLEKIRGNRIIIHGTGRHSEELAHVLRDFLADISAFTDEDPARHGSRFLGIPVLAPASAGDTGATDVVISSHLHQDDIWSRRAMYESRGLRVHRIYRD